MKNCAVKLIMRIRIIMGLFKSGNEKELERLTSRLEMDMANNYKDNAQADFCELEELYNQLKENSELKAKTCDKYERLIDIYKDKLKGYTHKEQKPEW